MRKRSWRSSQSGRDGGIRTNEDVGEGQPPPGGAETSYCSGLGVRKSRQGLTEVMNLLGSLAEGTRFGNPDAIETIDPDLTSSFRSQLLIEKSEAGDKPVNDDRT